MPDHLVYSTDGGRVNTCPTCGQPYKQCRCDQSTTSQTAPKKSDGIVRVMRDRKHRGGKTVTVITGVLASNETITTLAQQLKKLCGSGGTVKDGVIEIQGDHCEKVQAKLSELGGEPQLTNLRNSSNICLLCEQREHGCSAQEKWPNV